MMSDKPRSTRSRSKTQSKSRSDAKLSVKDTYCICNQPDDGSPMVCCSECAEWYHFRCVKLTAEQASELEVYVCPTCTKNTGRRMIMQWEGPEARHDVIHVVHDDEGSKPPPRPLTPPPALSPTESEDDPDSEDEYVAEPETAKPKGSSSRRRTRQYTTDSDLSDKDTHAAPHPSRKFSTPSSDQKASPAISSHLKRKSAVSHQAPAPKRKKSSDAPISAEDDPARKYCLGKLQDMFLPIFSRYPHKDANDGSGIKVEVKADDLTEEDKRRLAEEANVFAAELEQSVFELYSEADKHGKQGVGPKYKERFRALTFNLSQADRVAIHRRICLSTVSAKELAQMSSTDLANEEQKQSIILAEKEALEHSILQKTVVPRAKITHKGLQDIEDVNGEGAGLLRQREKEREKEDEERREERRERERQARLKAAEQHQKERANSISMPPESPIAPQSATWGGSLPMHHDGYSPSVGDSRPPIHPLFVPSVSDIQTSPEPELDIADLIHLDDDPIPQDTFGDQLATPALEASIMPAESIPSAPVPPEPVHPPPLTIPPPAPEPTITASPTEIAKPETPARGSFDLNALWSSPKAETISWEITKAPEPEQEQEQEQEHREHPIEVDALTQEATDQDFDIFLEKDHDMDVTQDERPQDPEVAFQAIPPVWTGKVAMPLDSSIPQMASVVARQIGGRTLGGDSPLWRTLFPSDTLRIDGRVPTENSAQFLLQTRLNPQKELIACAFSPENGDATLQSFGDFLLHKNRHGLVFPWGHQPKEYHPGKELYMVPLLASMPLPDFVELLDELRLPKVRQNNYVIGIWVLVRGKLVPPSAPPPLLSGTVSPIAMPPPPPPQIPPHAVSVQTLPPALQAFPQLANTALAAEVAALTPEQIQEMLRALSGNGNGVPGISGVLANAVATAQHTPLQHPVSHPGLPPPAPPHWTGGIPGYPVSPGVGLGYPPGPSVPPYGAPPHAQTSPHPHHGMLSPHGHGPPHAMHQPPSGPRAGGYGPPLGPGPSLGRYEEGHYDRGGWQPNGRSRGRGRGRGRGGGGGEFGGRPVDAGWGRRPSGQEEGRGGHRGRWDGPPPPRR